MSAFGRYTINESLNNTIDCNDTYVFDETNIALNENMVMLYRILDGKHDFGGGSSTDRSYINEDDCNQTILATQLAPVNSSININNLVVRKTLVRDNGMNIPLRNANIVSKANTVHEVFGFHEDALNKHSYNDSDMIQVELIDTNSNNVINKYCIKRPYYGVYKLMNKKNQFDRNEVARLKLDIANYGSHGIFSLKVGKKDNLKNNTDSLRTNIADTLELINQDIPYTIDATHISKDTILKPLFGQDSNAIFGDHMDPATVDNGDLYRIDKTDNQFQNTFHYCFIRGISLSLTLTNLRKGIMTYTFQYNGKTSSFNYPKKNMTISGLAPSVGDISLYIHDHILTDVKKVKNGCVFGMLGAVSKIITKAKSVPRGQTARLGYFSGFFTDILNSVSNVISPAELNQNEILTILTSLKTVGDQIRLSDTQLLKKITGKSRAFCATLDNFLFDFGVASRKCCLLGDSGSPSDFYIDVYLTRDQIAQQNANAEIINELNQEIILLLAKVGSIDGTAMQINYDDIINRVPRDNINIEQVEETASKEVKVGEKLNIYLMSSPDMSSSDDDQIKRQKELIYIINRCIEQHEKMELMTPLIQSYNTTEFASEFKRISTKIEDYATITQSNVGSITEENNNKRKYNLLNFELEVDGQPTKQNQGIILRDVRLLHLQYYILRITQYIGDNQATIYQMDITMLKMIVHMLDYMAFYGTTITLDQMKYMYNQAWSIFRHPSYRLPEHTVRFHLLDMESLYYKNRSNLSIAPFDISLPNSLIVGGSRDEDEDNLIHNFLYFIFDHTMSLRTKMIFKSANPTAFVVDLQNLLLRCSMFVENHGYNSLNTVLERVWTSRSKNEQEASIKKTTISEYIKNEHIRYLNEQNKSNQKPTTVLTQMTDADMEVDGGNKNYNQDGGAKDEYEQFDIIRDAFYDSLKHFVLGNYDPYTSMSILETTFNKDGTITIEREINPIGISQYGKEQYPGQPWNSINPDKNIPSGYNLAQFIYNGDPISYLTEDTSKSGIQNVSDIINTNDELSNDPNIVFNVITAKSGGKSKKSRTKKKSFKKKQAQNAKDKTRKYKKK